MYMFEYLKPSVMKSLEPLQQKFIVKLIMRDIDKDVAENNISPETAYWGYSKGLYGGDREVPSWKN